MKFDSINGKIHYFELRIALAKQTHEEGWWIVRHGCHIFFLQIPSVVRFCFQSIECELRFGDQQMLHHDWPQGGYTVVEVHQGLHKKWKNKKNTMNACKRFFTLKNLWKVDFLVKNQIFFRFLFKNTGLKSLNHSQRSVFTFRECEIRIPHIKLGVIG